MSVPQDDAKRLRIRDANFDMEVSQHGRDPSLGMPCLLVQTTSLGAYPSVAQRFYACSPLIVLGPEIEGGAGTITAEPSKFLALNLGSAIPPAGTNLLATFVDNRWVFRYDG